MRKTGESSLLSAFEHAEPTESEFENCCRLHFKLKDTYLYHTPTIMDSFLRYFCCLRCWYMLILLHVSPWTGGSTRIFHLFGVGVFLVWTWRQQADLPLWHWRTTFEASSAKDDDYLNPIAGELENPKVAEWRAPQTCAQSCFLSWPTSLWLCCFGKMRPFFGTFGWKLLAWFHGKATGNHGSSHENQGFPACFLHLILGERPFSLPRVLLRDSHHLVPKFGCSPAAFLERARLLISIENIIHWMILLVSC